MQKQITSVLLFALVALFNLSCQNNALEPAEQTNEKFISFQGEKVRIPADFPEELFGQTQEEFDAYITGKSNANARAVSRTMLTYTEIGEILSRNLAKYPRVNYDSISNFAQNGTSAHEKDDDGNQIHDYHAAMDLHNNQAARNWMDDEVKWGIGPLRKMPSVEKIIDTWYNRANSASFYNGANGDWVGILNLHGGNNSTTWNNLYNNLYGGHQHNVYIF